MDENPTVSQLQLTGDWKKPTDTDGLTILQPPKDIDATISAYEVSPSEMSAWPLFSLRPSINRLSFFQRHAKDFYFLEHPHLWPIRFEWEFGRTFLRNGGVKAVTNRAHAIRIRHHKSTYADLFNGNPTHLAR
jgi:hypothetical protein